MTNHAEPSTRQARALKNYTTSASDSSMSLSRPVHAFGEQPVEGESGGGSGKEGAGKRAGGSVRGKRGSWQAGESGDAAAAVAALSLVDQLQGMQLTASTAMLKVPYQRAVSSPSILSAADSPWNTEAAAACMSTMQCHAGSAGQRAAAAGTAASQGEEADTPMTPEEMLAAPFAGAGAATDATVLPVGSPAVVTLSEAFNFPGVSSALCSQSMQRMWTTVRHDGPDHLGLWVKCQAVVNMRVGGGNNGRGRGRGRGADQTVPVKAIAKSTRHAPHPMRRQPSVGN